jgi:hypothetical protein
MIQFVFVNLNIFLFCISILRTKEKSLESTVLLQQQNVICLHFESKRISTKN